MRDVQAFNQPWWDLDQVVAWADTREREAVDYAEFGRGGLRLPPSTAKIALWTSAASAHAAKGGRDINGELWRASGWPLEREGPPMPARSFAEAHLLELKLCVPDLREAKAVIEAFAAAKDHERFLIYSMFNEQFDNEWDIPTDPTMANLSAELRSLVRAYCARVKPGATSSDRPLRKFPTKDYLLQLFRAGRLIARGLTADDWGGLEIEVGGLHNRLCVWRTFPPRSDINGDVETVGIRRTEVLIEFPANSPAKPITDDDARRLLLEAIDKNGGYITQKNGAEIVRSRFPGFKKERAMQLVKELTQNMKRGPRGPRQ